MSMEIANIGGMSAPQIISGASPSAYASPTSKMSSLFASIDSSGAGVITQDQFNLAFQTMNPPGVFRAAGPDAIFSHLDPNSTGSVSQPDFVRGMTGLMRSLRSGQASGTAGNSASSVSTTPTDTLAASLQSLNQLGGTTDPLLGDGIGNALNVLA
jgi:hypothetical protein